MLLVGGENLIDMFHEQDSQTGVRGDAGKEINLQARLGGSPVNTAISAGLMGAHVGYLSPISSDHFGEAFVTRLVEAGVIHLGGRVDAPTSLAIVTVIDSAPSYQFYREGTAERQISAERLHPHLKQASMLHIGSLALAGERDGEEWRSLYHVAAEQGLFTSVDLNIRSLLIENVPKYRERLCAVMNDSNLIKLSDEDLAWWIDQEGLTDLEEAIPHVESLLTSFSPRILILTRGAEGSSLWVKNQSSKSYQRQEINVSPPERIQDTVGAGDTFMGSFLQQYQRVKESQSSDDHFPTLDQLVAACKVASAAASMNVERAGCQPPTIDELKQRLGSSELFA